MKIGILTSWNTQCGIAEYSRYLSNAMRRRDDVEVTILGSKNYADRRVADDEDYVRPTFAVLPWNDVGDHSFEVEAVLDAGYDVLHVQYEVLLYNQQGLYELLSRFQGLKVITYHDNCIDPSFPAHAFHLRYTHREDVGVGERFLLPFGIEERRPVVKTFGLGRSRKDVISETCEELGYDFEYSFGEHSWKSTAELTSWLRDSDCIVLYYDDVPSAGSSQAARTAIGTRRPTIINNVTWFRGVEGAFSIVDNPEQLRLALLAACSNSAIEDYSWDKIAANLVEDYRNNVHQLRHSDV